MTPHLMGQLAQYLCPYLSDEKKKVILRSIKELYVSGIYEGRNLFQLESIKLVCAYHGLEGADYRCKSHLESLQKMELIKQETDYAFSVEEAYLEKTISFQSLESRIQRYTKILQIFNKYPNQLIQLGVRAHSDSKIRFDGKEYVKVAIQAYESSLILYSKKDFPMNYALTQNNLGNAYGTLAKVENPVNNCETAIKAYKSSLTIYNFEDFPRDYALTQNNLGTAYRILAEVENKRENC